MKPTIQLLVAEDNQVNQKVIRIILEKNGYQFEFAQTGVEAVEKFTAGTFDMVLMDCQMPQMDGLEASRKMRSHEQAINRPRVPIVAMTANAMKGDKDRCLDAGMDDFLAKPFKSQDLVAIIRAWIDRNHEQGVLQ